MKIVVAVTQLQGSKAIMETVPSIWELVLPVYFMGTYKAPNNIDSYRCGFVFQKHLEQGTPILVNDAGGWCFLDKTAIIYSMWLCPVIPHKIYSAVTN